MKQIIDAEARAIVKGQGAAIEAGDLRQVAWVAVTEAKAKIEAASPFGAYVRKVARYAMKAYIRRLRRDALGHRERQR